MYKKFFNIINEKNKEIEKRIQRKKKKEKERNNVYQINACFNISDSTL